MRRKKTLQELTIKDNYKYTIRNRCDEIPEYPYDDGCQTIMLSTYGENDEEVPEALVNFLKYVKAELSESEREFDDRFVNQLQESVRMIKINRDMEGRFMTFEELMREERKEGREEGREEGRIEYKITLIQRLISMGKDASAIAETLGEDKDLINDLVNLISDNKGKSLEDLLDIWFQE